MRGTVYLPTFSIKFQLSIGNYTSPMDPYWIKDPCVMSSVAITTIAGVSPMLPGLFIQLTRRVGTSTGAKSSAFGKSKMRREDVNGK